jgi:haloalkane dehalogenase
MTPEWLDQDAWPFAPLERDGLHYVDEGPRAAPTIVFSHGTPTWSFEYRHLIRALSTARRCVAVDHLGFGLSRRPADASYTPEAHAERFARFVNALELPPKFTLVVHDFGGPIALPFALAHPERIEKLVVLNTWMWPFDDEPEMQKRARMVAGPLGRFMYRRLNASLRMLMPSVYGDRAKLTREVHGQYLAVFPDADSRERVLYALARALLDSRAFYASLWEKRAALADLDARIVWGMRDSAFRPAYIDKWRAILPKARVVELAGAGHWPHEEEPARVLEAM